MGSIDDVDYVRRVGAELQEAIGESARLRSEAIAITVNKLPKRKDGHGRIDH